MHLRKTDLKHINHWLWLARHDTNLTEPTTRIDTIFTPLENTFVYKNMMIQLDDLKQADARQHQLTVLLNARIGKLYKPKNIRLSGRRHKKPPIWYSRRKNFAQHKQRANTPTMSPSTITQTLTQLCRSWEHKLHNWYQISSTSPTAPSRLRNVTHRHAAKRYPPLRHDQGHQA